MFQELVKMETKLQKNISYILKFIECTRFMASSASNLFNNLSGGLHRIKRKLGHDHKKCETYGIKYKYCNCFCEYTNFRDNLIEWKCLRCNKNFLMKI